MLAAVKTALILSALTALAVPAYAAETILPGYWETTNEVISPIQSVKTERRCITKDEVAKFMLGPSNRHYACTYPTRSFESGRIALKGSCVSKKGQKLDVAGRGAYTPTTFNLTASIATDFLGIPIQGQARTEARRIADACPPPEAPAPETPATESPPAEPPAEPAPATAP